MKIESITVDMPTIYGLSHNIDFTHLNIEDLSTPPQRMDLSELEEFWYDDQELIELDELCYL